MPDRFDPTMDLGTAKDANGGAGTYRTTPSEMPDRTLAEKFDPAQNTATDLGTPTRETPNSAGFGGPPTGVDRFNGGSV